MVIKAIAMDLYRAQQKVHKLEDQLEAAPLAEKEPLREALRVARAECKQLRSMVEARKEIPAFRRDFKNKPRF